MRLARPATALCCIALVLLAGCSGVPGFGGGSGDAYTAPGEPLNASALQADHTENLREAGSFTVTINGSSAFGNDSTEQGTVVRADLENNRTLQQADIAQSMGGQATGGTQTLYVEDGTAYVRLAFGSDNGTQTQYQVVNLSGQASQQSPSRQFLTLNQYVSIIDGGNWTQQGTESFEGTTVTRYTVNGTDAFDASSLAAAGAPAPNVTDFEATMLVTADGTIRKLAFTFEAVAQGQPITVTNDLVVSDVGSTTVEQPGWLDEARNASSGSPPGDVAAPVAA